MANAKAAANSKPVKSADDMIDDAIAALAPVADQPKEANPELYELLDSITKQIQDLSAQRNAVRVQIKAAETPEAKKARQTQKLLEILKNGGNHPALRHF